MARTTISLPDDLKAEMDKLGADANWSGIAADSFRAELNRIKARKAALKGKSMQATIDRLKASKAAHAKAAETRGREAGAKWAREDAEYGELRALANGPPLSFDTDDAFGAPGIFFRLIGRDVDRQTVGDFGLDRDLGDDLYSAEFWDGFREGAEEVFEAVAAKLED
jgi:hypothetical protein